LAQQESLRPELLCVIVRHGMGGKVLRKGKQLGFKGATIFLGRGSKDYKSRRLHKFDLSESRKEIVLILAERRTVEETIGTLSAHFRFDRPHHGIAFRMPISEIQGSSQFANTTGEKGGKNPMYKAIFVIVDRGRAEDVIDAAYEAGQKGGTIIKARGAGAHETQKLFRMEIAPEKEVVLLLVKVEHCEHVTASIRKRLELDKPGNGLLFTQEVTEAYGLLSEDGTEKE